MRSAIVCTLDGSPIDSSYVHRLLPRLAARAGITKRALTPETNPL